MSKIFLVLWVSWSGKTTLLDELIRKHKDVFLYVPSYTTRSPRDWEVNGEKYNHISKREFDLALQNNEFLERAHSTSSEDLYWSKYLDLTKPLEKWLSSIKEIDIQWLKKVLLDWRINDILTTIFLDIPDSIIAKRLEHRWSDNEIQNRTMTAQRERADAHICDHILDASGSVDEVKYDFFTLLWLEW